MKCKFSLLLFLCVLSLWGQAQSLNLQELVNKKQFQEVVARADSLTPADSADYATMSAIGQAYEGLLRHKEAYQCFSLLEDGYEQCGCIERRCQECDQFRKDSGS